MPDAVAQKRQHVLWGYRERVTYLVDCLTHSLPLIFPPVLLPQPTICFRTTFCTTWAMSRGLRIKP